MTTPQVIDWPGLIQAFAQLLAPLGIAELTRLEASVTNPVELAAIRAALALLEAIGPSVQAWHFEPRHGLRQRGAFPTPRHRLAAATPFTPNAWHLAAIPSTFLTLPRQLSMLGNSTYGDCVSAEEGAAKMAYSIWGQVGKPPAITITDQTVIDWARAHRVLNGANLEPVIQMMQTSGMQATNGYRYCDGSPITIDYTNDATLRAAIMQGPVKIGVAANQLESAVNSTNGANGWVLANGYTDNREDHCVGLWGFGTIADLASAFVAAGYPVSIPHGTDTSVDAYALYTWACVGIIDRPTMIGLTGEAWLRTPTTLGVTPPAPSPSPAPTPIPTPTPIPVPSGYTGSLSLDTGLFGRVNLSYQNGLLVSVS